MAGNPVAANLLLLFIVAGGLLSAFTIKQEFFPEFDLDMVNISVVYPGASPTEVEQGIVLVVEEAVRGIDGVKKVSSLASEGVASVSVELILGTDKSKALTDIKNAVDRITSFPQDAERPVVRQLEAKQETISVVVYGDLDQRTLRGFAEQVRDDLLRLEGVTLVELFGVKTPEIGIELSTETLRSYGLTLDGVARKIASESIDLPGGNVKTRGGEVLLRTVERRDLGREFEEINVVNTPTGSRVKLGDIATVKDDFVESDVAASFNGKPAAMVKVYRTGDQTPLGVADVVHDYVRQLKTRLPPGVEVGTWNDTAEVFRGRFDLLLNNGYIGLALVFLILGLLLEIRLAFWVTVGIPVSFLGSLLFVPAYDVSINMVSLFAFILTLGMVVDDAIVVGESVFEYRKKGVPFLKAAIQGTREVAMPVVFSVLTTIAAFTPMFFVSGIGGKMFRVIPAVVISVLVVSLIECIFILPAHLAHTGKGATKGILGALRKGQQRIGDLFERIAKKSYAPTLRFVLKWRYLTIAVATALLIVTIGLIAGGRVGFSLMPKVESDMVTATAVMPFGISIVETKKVEQTILRAANEVLATHGGDRISRGVYSQVGIPLSMGGPMSRLGLANTGSHFAGVRVFMVTSDKRGISADQFVREWRKAIGDIPGVETLSFNSEAVASNGDTVDIQLSHGDMDTLKRAASELAETMGTYTGVQDIDDGFALGKPSLDFRLKEAARSLGLTAMDLARQVRNAFYGAEALRQQRGREEIRVMVRLPEEERRSEHNVEELILRTRDGGEIPMADAAIVKRSRSYTEINRVDGRRVVDVTGEVDSTVTSSNKVQSTLEREVLPKLVAEYPGLDYVPAGTNKDAMDSMQSLLLGWIVALVAMFGLLAVPLASYSQPVFVVMSSIPYGFIGAIAGLLIMGFEGSLIGMMGVVALSGVIVNGALVLVHAANRFRDEGFSAHDSIYKAGLRRFRPIVLTSVTTFCGLAPMIFESSVQARFLMPMAITLGFGILFGAFVTLIVSPSLYLMLEDLKQLLNIKDRASVLDDSLEVSEADK
ncbi:MAG: efflux RND transporter permease subunit [Proteobacteria bacterium]|nr:efflux RND transporter permease subunit [Pseudomonadota bacterium]